MSVHLFLLGNVRPSMILSTHSSFCFFDLCCLLLIHWLTGRKAPSYLLTYLYSVLCFVLLFFLDFAFISPEWNTADAEIKVSSADNPELSEVLSSKSGAGQNIAMLASPTAGNFPFLIYTFPVNSTSFCPDPLTSFPCVNCGYQVPVLWTCRIGFVYFFVFPQKTKRS